MKYSYQLVAPILPPFTIIGFFLDMQIANAIKKKYYQNTIKDFAGLKANLKYRYWEANQITDQV
jgi:hypothetical protein